MARMRKLFALVLLLLPSLLFAQALDTTAVDRIATTTMLRWRVPGLAIAIVRDDRIVYVKGFGVKEIGKPEPITADTLFELGSTTKAFTSTAAALLVGEKKLAWDDPVRKHVTWFHLSDPCADSLVTLRDLLTHRTGVATRDELWDNARYSRDEVLRALASIPVNKPIRSAYQYSNIMFTLAGDVVASAAGMPWEEVIRTRLFTPLGMTHSRITLDEWTKSDHALGYDYDRDHDAVKPHPFNDYANIAPAGTVKTSARDMSQWLRFHLANGAIDGKQIVDADALLATKSPQVALSLTTASQPVSNVITYGMGWTVSDYRGTLLVAHSGSLNGFRTQVALLPKLNAGVVVIANIGRSNAPLAARNAILDLLANAQATRDWNAYYLDLDDKSVAKGKAAIAAREAERKPDTKPSHDLADYAGTYENAGYGKVVVTLDAGSLVLRWGHATLPMTHWHYDTFEAKSDEEDLDELIPFTTGTDGTIKSLIMFGETFVKPKVSA
jgi:CubicO group peptidase (beta-lactamase class C family)